MTEKESTEKKIRNIRSQNRKKYSAEEKIRIVLEGLRGDESIAELCRREGLSQSMYYKWSKECGGPIELDSFWGPLQFFTEFKLPTFSLSKLQD